MDTNNAILFTFGLIFLLLGFFSPIINSEFGNEYTENDIDSYTEAGQEDLETSDIMLFLSGLFFWVFGAPVWLNLILTIMRVIFIVIMYDKLTQLIP